MNPIPPLDSQAAGRDNATPVSVASSLFSKAVHGCPDFETRAFRFRNSSGTAKNTDAATLYENVLTIQTGGFGMVVTNPANARLRDKIRFKHFSAVLAAAHRAGKMKEIP